MTSSEDINEYILYILEKKKCSAAYVNTSISAIKFMFNNVIRRTDININMFRVKKEKNLPYILSQE